MIRLAVVVEGETEEAFVAGVLRPHLMEFGIETVPILIASGRRKDGGGDVHVDILISDLIDALNEGEYSAATSLVDFYGFRDKGDRTAEQLEGFILDEIRRRRNNNPPVRPYIRCMNSRVCFSRIQRHSTSSEDVELDRILRGCVKFETNSVLRKT